MTQKHIPRDTLQHEIQAGQVYGDSRSKTEDKEGNVEYEEKLRLVYEDDERVLLRSNFDMERPKGKHYRTELRSTFEDNAASKRYALLEDTEGAPKMPTDGITTSLIVLKRQRDIHSRSNGRKSQHKVEALDEAIAEVEALDPTPVDWTTVDGVGQGTADNLAEAGYKTDADIRGESDEVLLAIGGVGDKNLQRIRKRTGATDGGS